MNQTSCLRLAAALAFLAVALGAFGAHGLQAVFEKHPPAADWWQIAAFYHFFHALALLVLAAAWRPVPAGPCWLFFIGILLFSGSLYLLALTNLRWLGAVTPFGGVCFLAGWLWLALRPPAVSR